jgi:hypothetical protein
MAGANGGRKGHPQLTALVYRRDHVQQEAADG